MRIFFSASTLWFYDETRKEEYHNGIGWPDDAIEISDDEWNKYTQIPPDGFILGATSCLLYTSDAPTTPLLSVDLGGRRIIKKKKKKKKKKKQKKK